MKVMKSTIIRSLKLLIPILLIILMTTTYILYTTFSTENSVKKYTEKKIDKSIKPMICTGNTPVYISFRDNKSLFITDYLGEYLFDSLDIILTKIKSTPLLTDTNTALINLLNIAEFLKIEIQE